MSSQPPDRSSLARRDFIRDLAGVLAVTQLGQRVVPAPSARFVGIQMGPHTMLDEGIERTLDLVQETAAVNVVMPEVVMRGWRRLLHNQRALYVKRLLLFEPHVILSSVPYQLFR